MVISDKLYLMIKFIKNDQMVTRIITLLMKTRYVQKSIAWKWKGFRVHLNQHVYRAYNQLRHNSQLLMRKYYMGKKKLKQVGY